MADPQKRPASKDRRTHSARARLTPPLVPEILSKEDIMKQAKERAKSAKLNRSKQTASTKLFPKATNQQRFSSMYAQHYEGAYAPPAEIRPTSPTRRHNPHPGKVIAVAPSSHNFQLVPHT